MTRTIHDPETFAAFQAFGQATVAFLEVSDLIVTGPELNSEASELLSELQVTQARLRCLFACGRDQPGSDRPGPGQSDN